MFWNLPFTCLVLNSNWEFFFVRSTSGHPALPCLQVRKVFNLNLRLPLNLLMTINCPQQTRVFLDFTSHCIPLALFSKASFFWLSRLKHLDLCRTKWNRN